MPEKILKKLNSKILPQWKICFFAAIIVGLLTHLYKITSWLPNWDSLVFRYDPQNMVGLGRWFLPVVCSASSFYDLPLLNGLLAILFHALGAVLICRILNVEKKVPAALIGAVIVTFPAVTSVMMYNYVADGYGIAFFLSVLAAFYMTKEKPNYLVSAFLIALSAGIYQAYITVTVMLILLCLIDGILYRDETFSDTLKKALYMLLSGVFGMVLYTVILNIILSVFSIKLLDYQGIQGASTLAGIDLAASLYVVKETFINFFFDISKGFSTLVIINIFVMLYTLFYYIKHVISSKIYKKPLCLSALLFFGASLILGAGILAFVNAGIDYHNLMIMGYSVFYLFFIIIYERGKEQNEKYTSAKRWTVLITVAAIVFNQIVIANVSYHKAQMAYEKSYGVILRIADRIEQTAGAEACDKILIVGALSGSEDYSVNLPPDITGITDGFIIRADDETVGQSVLTSTLNDYCGKSYEFLSGEDKKNFIKREEVKSMSAWPLPGSVAVVDGTLVIKLSSECEN